MIACAALTALFNFFATFYMPQRWLTLVVTIVIYAAIGVIVHLIIVLDKDDWKKIRTILKK